MCGAGMGMISCPPMQLSILNKTEEYFDCRTGQNFMDRNNFPISIFQFPFPVFIDCGFMMYSSMVMVKEAD